MANTLKEYDYLIDTHTHIDADEFKGDFAETVSRAEGANVKKIVIPAIEPNRFERLQQLTEQYENVYQGIGIHPHSADKFTEQVGNDIRNATKRDKVIAIGEIGLEYFYDFIDKKVQQEVFEWHLKLSAESGLPALIHSRDAEQMCIDTFYKIKYDTKGELNGVLHCFSENRKIMEEAIDTGLMVSFTGNITFKKFANLEAVEAVPLDKFMIETDAPYMAPVPFRGKRNEPSYVPNVAQKIAEVKNLPLEKVIHHSTENAMEFFKFTLISFIMLAFGVSTHAQGRYDGYEDDTEEVDNTTDKTFGIGVLIGGNTIIDNLTYIEDDGRVGTSSRSQDGLLAFGGNLDYHFNRYFSTELSYIYSQNSAITEDFPDIDPYTYNKILAMANFNLNPDNAINFIIGVGGGMVFAEETYSIAAPIPGNPDNVEPVTFEFENFLLSASFGIGYDLQIQEQIINFNAGFLFMLQQEELTGNFFITNNRGANQLFEDVPFNRYFAVPRLSITYYPVW